MSLLDSLLKGVSMETTRKKIIQDCSHTKKIMNQYDETSIAKEEMIKHRKELHFINKVVMEHDFAYEKYQKISNHLSNVKNEIEEFELELKRMKDTLDEDSQLRIISQFDEVELKMESYTMQDFMDDARSKFDNSEKEYEKLLSKYKFKNNDIVV